jgi:molybdopterin converting factor small subunit
MQVTVRLSHDLARMAGMARIPVTLDAGATVADLVAALGTRFPALAPGLAAAVPVVDGRHTGRQEPLAAGQEIALLTPVGGGC